MTLNWFKYASPATFYPVGGRMIPWFAWSAALLAAIGLYIGLVVAPTDFQQGDAYRIIFIHVPAAWMSMFLYVVMAVWSALALGFNTRLSAMMAQAIAPTGALMTFIALWSGAFWGRPTWGTYWAWDARMTSELILLFLYLGIIALRNAIDDPRRADRACAILSLVGAINVPIISIRSNGGTRCTRAPPCGPASRRWPRSCWRACSSCRSRHGSTRSPSCSFARGRSSSSASAARRGSRAWGNFGHE